MVYAIYAVLAVVAFLTVLNGFLRGAKKAQIDVLLSLLLLGLVIAAFVVAGWERGLVAIGIAFISAIVTRPIAARTASRLFSLPAGERTGYVGLPPRPLERISQQLGRQTDPSKLVEEMLSGSDRPTNAESALLDYCQSQPAIKAVMNEFQVSGDDLQELYFQLVAVGAGQWTCWHWVAASSLAYPEALRYVLARRGEDIRETAFNLIMYFEKGSSLDMRPRITIRPETRRLTRRIASATAVAAGLVTTLLMLLFGLPDFLGIVSVLREENFTRIKVFYATDRLPAGRDGRLTQYGGKWSEALQYGIAEVSLPRDHRVGVVESPSVWRLEFRADPEQHVYLHSAEPVTSQEFAGRIREAVGRSNGKEILLFVHGFNVSFEDALKRTAQIFYDLALPGVPVTYAWPSQAKLGPVAYVADGNMADVTVPHLKSFLVELAHQSGARRIHLIAHSMGNKILARSLDAIVADTTVRPKPRFNHIALTAPDIDERVIIDIAARVYPLAERITMYASDNDSALQLASEYTRSRRAGQAGANILILPHIDTVDASNVDTSLVGHFYYGSNRSVLSDIYYVVRFNQSPDDRFLLRRIEIPRGRYWQFKP